MKHVKYAGYVLALAFCANTVAAPLACKSSTIDDTTAKTHCLVGHYDAAVLYPLLINVDAVLGFNVWQQEKGAFYSDLESVAAHAGTGARAQGHWSIDNLRALMSDFLLMQPGGRKGGSDMYTYGYYQPDLGAVGQPEVAEIIAAALPESQATQVSAPAGITAAVSDTLTDPVVLEFSSAIQSAANLVATPAPAPPAAADSTTEYPVNVVPEQGTDEGEYEGDRPTPVAEPSILALLVIGLFALGLFGRRSAS